MGADAGHPPRLSGPSDLSQSSQTATLDDSRTWMQDLPLGSAIHGLSTFNSAASLGRQNTILAAGSSPHRNARELKTILGSANAKLKRDSSLPLNKSTDSSVDASVLHLEGGNARARVQLDLILENDTCVQGGCLNGLILLTVRKKGNEIVMLSEGKMRIIGFESIMHEKERAAFYELSVPLSAICLRDPDDLYLAGPNDDGFTLANEGQFTIPFALYLDPKATSLPPKGSFPPHSGVALRYILMASIRIKDPLSDDKSLAHFYRDVHIWPRWDLAFCLTPLPRPIQVTMSGLEGNLKFSIILQRLQWFAGQHCHLKFYVVNNTSKPIKNLTVELHRDTITWRPRGDPAVTDDFGEPETSTVSKLILVSSLPAGDRAEKGYASARGWWAGVHGGESLHFYHSLLLPPDALSVTKGRLLEIEYRIKATISSGNLLPTELSAEVPIRIINFISVDPPPSQANTTPALMTRSSVASNATLPGPPYSAILAATLDPGSGDMQRGESALNTKELVPPPMMALDSERSRSCAGRFADLYYQGQQGDPMHQEPRESRSAKEHDGTTLEFFPSHIRL
ncbi:hypothetical protein FA13DRAFT_1704541 [Coprinellus micaceus]|uniref:Arrestin C-terminal-like domain-containing protein n=1 Tax=Coprinellus micaceus TaxID=71717 RepID=A0A4Y7TXH9_COPMI|nr:hypothetical protein FA13DRAFT_1704541 [Coprinellus micaceus]